MIGSIIYFTGIIIAIVLLGKLANARQHMWQEKRDEELLLADTNLFLSGWSRYDSGVVHDERLKAVVGQAEAMAEIERQRIAAEDAEVEAVPDDVLIQGFKDAIHRSAIYNGPPEAPLVHDRKTRDIAMFREVEATKARRGILSMSDELNG